VLHDVPIGFFSLEMSVQQLVMRLMCAEARVDAHKVRTGRLPEDEWRKLSVSVGRLYKAKVFIDDTPGLGILELRAKARRLKAEHNIGLVIVDYLQLMQGPRSAQSREQEISAISRSLKALAKELNIPVIALSQLNRAVEARTDKRPALADLRESGAIEQDADVVMFVHRPEMYGIEAEDGQSTEGLAEIIIGKQRNGPVDTVKLAFVKQYARFDNKMLYPREQFLPPPPEPGDNPF
jgi:replicative DNA helicase